MKTVGALFCMLQRMLHEHSGDLAAREAEMITEHLLHISRPDVHLDRTKKVSEEMWRHAQSIAHKRLEGIPLAYALGVCHFYDKDFLVSPAVLIPRPDTEMLVETVLRFETGENLTCLDMGTGSGVIADTLQRHRPRWRVTALDISINALEVASKNCSVSVRLVCADCLEAILPAGQIDVIVSNPPYIANAVYEHLDSEVRLQEPAVALRAGETGLDFYGCLARESPSRLRAGGRVYCEIGYDQKAMVERLFSAPPWSHARVFPDLAGRPRVLRATVEASDAQGHKRYAA